MHSLCVRRSEKNKEMNLAKNAIRRNVIDR